MKYKISLSTYSPDIVEAFSALRCKKSQFTEQALIHFIGTTKGKNTLRLMVGDTTIVKHNIGKGGDHHKWQTVDKKEAGRISVDSFFD